MKYFILLIISSLSFVINDKLDSCEVFEAHYSFKSVLTNPKYQCYGKPSEKYRKKNCKYLECNGVYYLQTFCKNGRITTQFYSSETDCEYSETSYHNNLNLGITIPCVCDDNLDIGDDY